MARKNTSENRRDSRAADDRSCSNADHVSATQPLMLRLTGVRPMTTAQQQRFDMLFDALIAHWLARSGSNKGEGND